LVRRDALLLGAGNIVVIVLQLCFRGILVVALAPVDYGRLSLILSIYNTVWIIGASGLPNSVARYIAVANTKQDSAIIRSAVIAGAWPTVIAATVVSGVSALLLSSPWAFVLAAMGLPGLVYSLLTMGILRGRGRMMSAATVMPIAAVGEVAPLTILWLSGAAITPLSAFAVFCLGNVIGLGVGVALTVRSSPGRTSRSNLSDGTLASVPTPRGLLAFSAWLAVATLGVAALPLVIRSAAAIDSYTTVAIIDVALILLAVPQRVGVVLVHAVVPHATRALGEGNKNMAISRREHLLMIAPFALAAGIVAFTPLVGWIFGLLGRPEYSDSARYLTMALLAGPARILYGLVEGVLIAHGESRFLALTSLAIAAVSGVAIVAITLLGSVEVAFAVFVASFWLIYLVAFARVTKLTTIPSSISQPVFS
jgi:O-antigen/teichoic acid export membrane protein